MGGAPAGRRDGFAPIRDYAALSDGQTIALVARDGQIDWWPVPALDSPPVCAGILDPEAGGRFVLSAGEDVTVERRYVPGSNVLETTFLTDTGSARVTDALNTGDHGPLPWTELARRVDGLRGAVTFTWAFEPGSRFGQARPWVSTGGPVPVVTLGDQTMAVVTDGAVVTTAGPHAVRGRLRVESGERALVAVVASNDAPLYLPTASAVDDRLDRTIESWRRWADQLRDAGRWTTAMVRSALALRALMADATGAIAAAGTTSLPEAIGGEKNWDYRFAWVRDSSFVVDALMQLGLHEEVHATVRWLLAALRRSEPDVKVFYTLRGTEPGGEATIGAPGYRHSRPARSGNAAAGQTQLGTYGDLLDTIRRYVSDGHVLDDATGRLLNAVANRCCDAWLQKDSGIWELDQLEHYTISKIGCWTALDRAASLAEEGQLPDGSAPRWRAEAEEIKAWVDTHCWSDDRQAYTFYAGTDDLDAAVLLAGRTGFERGPRLTSTVDAVAATLARGPFVYRYSGMEHIEGAFVACTFWLVDAMAFCGRLERARALMEEAVERANDVGLYAEMIDPATGAFLGNHPQALSHLSLINAAHTLTARGVT